MSTLTIARALRAAEVVEAHVACACVGATYVDRYSNAVLCRACHRTVVPATPGSFEREYAEKCGRPFTEQEDGSSRCNKCRGDYYACDC